MCWPAADILFGFLLVIKRIPLMSVVVAAAAIAVVLNLHRRRREKEAFS